MDPRRPDHRAAASSVAAGGSHGAPKHERRARPHEPAGALDVTWAHGTLGDLIREAAGRFVLGPLMDLYTRRRVFGTKRLARLRAPIVIVANHSSHVDTPALLRALPRPWRRRTVVAAAVDYFYRNRLRALLVSIFFNTVPIERRRSPRSVDHIDRLLARGYSVIFYPQGTRSRDGAPGSLRPGAAVLAHRHHIPLVPVRINGTHAVMPPGAPWMRRPSRNPFSRRHAVTITFGEPIAPDAEDCEAVMARVAAFLDDRA